MFAKDPSSKSSSRNPSETMVGAGAKLDGVIDSPTNIYIDGVFSGKLSCSATVVVNLGALVKATVQADCVIVHGYIEGPVHATERIQVGPTGRIKGDVKAGAVRVAEGGILDGNCQIIPSEEESSAL